MDRFGIATGIKTGVSNIWITYNLVDYPFTKLTVNPVMTITVAPNPAPANVGDIVTFTAMGKYDDPSLPQKDLTNLAMWTSNNNTIASFGGSFPNTNNQASANNPGTATITATWGTPYGQTAVGSSIMTVGANGRCRHASLTSYLQIDVQWKDELLGNHTASGSLSSVAGVPVYTNSIGWVGCQIVTMAMVLSTAGNPTNPKDFNATMKKDGRFDIYNGLDWIVVKDYSNNKITSVRNITSSEVTQELSKCNLVVAQLPTTFHGCAHWVMIDKDEGNGMISGYDPIRGAKTWSISDFCSGFKVIELKK